MVGNGTVPCPVGTDVRPWAQGAARIAGTTNQILVPYSTICTATGKVVASGFAQYNAVTEQLVANTPDVFQAPYPSGPWTAKASGGTGCDRTGGTYPPNNNQVRHCRGLILHAEIGSATSVVFSYAQLKNTVPRLEKPTDNQIPLRSVPITP